MAAAAAAAAGMMKYCSSRDVLPFPAMVAMECANVGLNTLFKAATDRGLISYHIFIVYAYAVAALALSPTLFLSHRLRELPQLNFSIMSKIGLLGVIGCLSQNLGYRGINYSSPALASALSNLVPAFTFILAVVFSCNRGFVHRAQLGCLEDRLHIALLSVVCSGLFGSFLNNVVHAWVIHLKGPFFVSMFKPLSIVIAVTMGVIFLRDGIYLGSVIEATVVSVGFYIVMWGKAQEKIADEQKASSSASINNQRVPLLQDGKKDHDQV